MKLTIQLQLLPTAAQKAELLTTMERFNEAATFAARVGFDAGVFGQVKIHHLAYHEIRERFGLTAQMAVRAIAKAVECFQRDKTTCPVFKPRSAICYDQRVMSFKGLTTVSLWAMTGRLLIPFVCGAYQKERQGRIKGQADLVYRQGKFFLLCTIDLLRNRSDSGQGCTGVDMGIVEIATDSTGESFSGSGIETKRRHYARRRAGMNRVGTKSARRRLSKIRKREANFRRNTNHCIANTIVAKAKVIRSPRVPSKTSVESGIGPRSTRRNAIVSVAGVSLNLASFWRTRRHSRGFPWSRSTRAIPVGPAPSVGIVRKPTGRLRPISSACTVDTPRMPISTRLGTSEPGHLSRVPTVEC